MALPETTPLRNTNGEQHKWESQKLESPLSVPILTYKYVAIWE